MSNKKSGFILFMTFAMLALCTALVNMFMIKGIAHKRFTASLLKQQELVQFAIATTALGQSILAISAQELKPAEKDSESQSTEKGSEKSSAPMLEKLLLEKALPLLNKTKKINFDQLDKSFPVVINLTFFCESGKININGLFDLVHKKFYDEGVQGRDGKLFATWLFDKIASLTGKPSLLQPFVEFMKQRKSALNDVTELLLIKEFAACFQDAIFYSNDKVLAKDEKNRKKIFLTDIFTVVSENDTIQPWLLSPSVCVLLGIMPTIEKVEKSEKKIDLSKFQPKSDWSKDWQATLQPIYGIPYEQIPEGIRFILSTQFQAKIYSMLATVQLGAIDSESMIVEIFAILKQKRLSDGSIAYDIIKVYQV